METSTPKKISTMTGVFATREDAENAYKTLIGLGYEAEEITLIMSEETCGKLYHHSGSDFYTDNLKHHRKKLQVTRISDALDVYGRFVAIPGLALVVVGKLNEGGLRAMSSSVMSDDYAEYFKRRIQDGEILIDFGLHTPKEQKLLLGLWEDYGGMPLVRRVTNAA
ncbi:hypothetical protein [Dyadobacter luticola]|uniref:General stress protein 17M-like domain-containing protein n=1 Tax=Dyadobacter luticola TaxID=1979387 RepID=A0A5R9L5B4_9BACT|nr:hypothetical protein [Dyadobacter luticola]TLV03537.1 hypothetical protein FEN17_08015 [Dyadobacter luticola]